MADKCAKDSTATLKKGTTVFTLRTYAWICSFLLFFVMIVFPDIYFQDRDLQVLVKDRSDEYIDIKHSLDLPFPLQAKLLKKYDAQCAGKRVYVYELPLKFNTGLSELCDRGLILWLNLCRHFHNSGFGLKLRSKEEGWSDWYGSDAYMMEVIFHARMQTYPCRTYERSRADVFFIPWYAGLDALPWLYNKNVTVPKRGRFGKEIFEWLDVNGGESWRRYGGRDHFLVLGRTAWDFFLSDDNDTDRWGTGFFALPYARNLTSLMLERRERFDNERAVPYPTSFHPSSPAILRKWIKKVKLTKRDYLMAYVGAPRPHMDESIRGIIGSQCKDAKVKKTCFFVDCSKMKCSHDPIPISKALIRSNFCLQPRGDTATRRSAFDCMIAGSIPVFFHESTAYTQYAWHLPADRQNYSVYISERDIRRGVSVRHVLQSFSPERIRAMRKNIVALIPGLVYNNYASQPHNYASQPQSDSTDAFDLSIRGVLHRAAAYKISLR